MNIKTLFKNIEKANSEQERIKSDPLLDIEYTGDLEKDCEKELNAVQKAFYERRQKEQERFEIATDSEYWFCVCFSTRDQKEHFLKEMGLLDIGDKYLDGYEVAKKFNITLPEQNIDFKTR